MGGCFSVSLSCDQMVNQVSQWLCLKESYIHNLPKNLESLEKAMKNLKAKRDDVQRRVDREEFTRRQRRLEQVDLWFKDVLAIDNQVSDLLSTCDIELQRLCLCRLCSKNFKKSYPYGKRVITKLKDVEDLDFKGNFDVVTEAISVVQDEELPIQPIIVGRETFLEKVWNHLMKEEVGIVGLYGMGGVGKTTLLTQINNKFIETSGIFDVVIWVVVSNYATIYKVQGDIGEKLGLTGEGWDQKRENMRAREIHNVLRRKKFVLLLDDIWAKLNLEAVGIPYPCRENRCKVAFTTRSRDVCGRMGVDDPWKVNCLDHTPAWDLFQKKVGVNTLESDPDIPQLAEKVAKKCRGLPLALNVIGEAMACKTKVQEWKHAIDVLTSSAIEFPDMEHEILPILKYSYDNLKSEQLQSCFLYCSLFPEDFEIDKIKLIEYWICEGFIDEKIGWERALNQGHEILGTLFRACLLLDNSKDDRVVKIHDVVREMALWISSDLGKYKDQCIVQAGVRLREVPKVKNWRVVKRMSLMDNEINKISGHRECLQLTTLLLQKNSNLVNISKQFFQSMPKLLVLDLSKDYNLDKIPEEISELVSLRYLDLSSTNIKRLPLGLQEMKMLIYLNLESTYELENLDGVSNLSSLRIIRLRFSKIMLNMRLMKEFELLEHLEYITINISPSIVGEKWFYDSRVMRCIQSVKIIEPREEEAERILVWPAGFVNLREVYIKRCGMLEIKMEKIRLEKSLTSPCFPTTLSSLHLNRCDGFKDLTWLMFAPNLIHLEVAGSKEVESIISEEKAANVLEMEKTYIITLLFQKLQSLWLRGLPELKSICWTSLSFPCLKILVIASCPKLRKLPLNSQSVIKVEEFVIFYHSDAEWKESVEWEDETTKLRFLPSFKEGIIAVSE